MIKSPSARYHLDMISSLNIGADIRSNEDIESLGKLQQLPISALLDLFPTPPVGLPTQNNALKQAEKKGKSEKKNGKIFGSMLRSSWTGLSGNGVSPGALTPQESRKSSISVASPTSPSMSNISTDANFQANTLEGSMNELQRDDLLVYQKPAGLPDRDYVDLLKRCCRGVIAPKEQEVLFKFLAALPSGTMKDLQKGVHDLLIDKAPAVKSKSAMATFTETLGRGTGTLLLVDISKYFLDFHMKGRRAQIMEQARDSFFIEIKSGKTKFTITGPEQTPGYELHIEPTSGKLKTKEKEEIKIRVIIKRPVKISEVLSVEIEGSHKYFVVLNLSSEWSHFGCPLEELEYCQDEAIKGYPRRVPKVLATLRELLVSKGGLETEEIFRKQLEEEKTTLVRQQFDNSQHLDTLTPEMLSTLIKIWFRELPNRIFDVTIDQVISCDNEKSCLDLYHERVHPELVDISNWLMDLMIAVLHCKDKNRMTSKKLAIVFAPNVFPVNAGSTNAEYLRKQANVFHNILEYRLKEI